jgi:glutamine amidotransferase-like uncharacterized protein
VVCLTECDLEASNRKRPRPDQGCCATGGNKYFRATAIEETHMQSMCIMPSDRVHPDTLKIEVVCSPELSVGLPNCVTVPYHNSEGHSVNDDYRFYPDNGGMFLGKCTGWIAQRYRTQFES